VLGFSFDRAPDELFPTPTRIVPVVLVAESATPAISIGGASSPPVRACGGSGGGGASTGCGGAGAADAGVGETRATRFRGTTLGGGSTGIASGIGSGFGTTATRRVLLVRIGMSAPRMRDSPLTPVK